jgi:uncharacterized membrane protein
MDRFHRDTKYTLLVLNNINVSVMTNCHKVLVVRLPALNQNKFYSRTVMQSKWEQIADKQIIKHGSTPGAIVS